MVNSIGDVGTGGKPLSNWPRATLSVPEVAEILGISRNSGYEMARLGTLPVRVIRLGRRMVVSKSELERFLDGSGEGGRARVVPDGPQL